MLISVLLNSGTAVTLSGTSRTVGGVVGVTIFSTVYNNKYNCEQWKSRKENKPNRTNLAFSICTWPQLYLLL